jgi:hypothetical protein
MSHTPGPWETGDVQWMTNQRTHVGYSYRPITAGTWEVATVWEDACDKEMAANVRLIAAAPDMLAALLRVREVFEQLSEGDWRELDATYVDQLIESDGLRGCDRAIAKATGDER